jgi:membrane-bound lytic murein transglycosylase D
MSNQNHVQPLLDLAELSLTGFLEEVVVRFFYVTLLLAAGLVTSSFYIPSSVLFARRTLDETTAREMDRETEVFNRMSKLVARGDECVPIRVGGKGQIDRQYLSCSSEAFRRDGERIQVSENISVPQSIARRVNFWRRVYSLWSKNQNVLHVAEYPEVVLEIHDSTRLKNLGDKVRERMMRPEIQKRRNHYRQILVKFAYTRNIDVSKLSPSEQRVYRLFDHIKDANKFKIAASSIRVQRGQREYIASGLEIAPKYLVHTEEEFRRQGLMPELARLAFIESSFNLQARSKVGASGVYQVMPETGRDYLIVTPEIDERNDPIKASRAAAKLLALNYKILGEWPLAITAYNHGVGGISRAMREKGTNDIVKLINEYRGRNFGFASKNFYAGFLGLLMSLKNSAKVFPEVVSAQPLKFVTVRVGGMTVAAVKQKYKLSTTTIVTYNPDITWRFMRSGQSFPKRYILKIPTRSSGVNMASVSPVNR